jgi:hypothetical protein
MEGRHVLKRCVADLYTMIITAVVGAVCCLYEISALTREDLLKISRNVSDDVNSNVLVLPSLDSMYIWNEMWRINVDGYFRGYSGDAPVLFYPQWVGPDGFGNSVGYYLEAISCAKFAGMHFVGFETNLWYHGHELPSNVSKIFSSSLPKVIVHNAPIPSIRQIKRDSCWPNAFPWQTSKSLMWGNLPEIRGFLVDFSGSLRSVLKFGSTAYSVTDFELVLNRRDNFRYENDGHRYGSRRLEIRSAVLPFVPHVSILFRCVDMLEHGDGSPYGFLNFNVYKHMIPEGAPQIYILTESLYYSSSRDNPLRSSVKVCVNITKTLADYLSNEFVNTTVAVRRGHSAEGFYQLSHSQIMISPPSTFGFYAGVAQGDDHDEYFPETGLIASGINLFVHKGFHWFPFPKIVQFGQYSVKHGINETVFLSMLLASI